MIVSYDGTRYAGWQVQPHHTTIQGELERVLHRLTGEKGRVQCSGRTDAGVHARGQVVHFDLGVPAVEKKLVLGFNALLEKDIRVLSLRKAPPTFHARFGVTGKEYRYFVWNGEVLPPFLRNFRTHVRAPLDTAAMNRAARVLTGKHDFAAFSANPNREVDGTIRHLRELKVGRRGREVVIVARGNGFLYKMVRSLAGFLIRVGAGDLDAESAGAILHSKTRTARVPTAEPQGLFLWHVSY